MKYLFNFRLRDAMFLVFACITPVPLKASNMRPIHMYIIYIYILEGIIRFSMLSSIRFRSENSFIPID